jgi:hypothetical protein
MFLLKSATGLITQTKDVEYFNNLKAKVINDDEVNRFWVMFDDSQSDKHWMLDTNQEITRTVKGSWVNLLNCQTDKRFIHFHVLRILAHAERDPKSRIHNNDCILKLKERFQSGMLKEALNHSEEREGRVDLKACQLKERVRTCSLIICAQFGDSEGCLLLAERFKQGLGVDSDEKVSLVYLKMYTRRENIRDLSKYIRDIEQARKTDASQECKKKSLCTDLVEETDPLHIGAILLNLPGDYLVEVIERIAHSEGRLQIAPWLEKMSSEQLSDLTRSESCEYDVLFHLFQSLNEEQHRRLSVDFKASMEEWSEASIAAFFFLGGSYQELQFEVSPKLLRSLLRIREHSSELIAKLAMYILKQQDHENFYEKFILALNDFLPADRSSRERIFVILLFQELMHGGDGMENMRSKLIDSFRVESSVPLLASIFELLLPRLDGAQLSRMFTNNMRAQYLAIIETLYTQSNTLFLKTIVCIGEEKCSQVFDADPYAAVKLYKCKRHQIKDTPSQELSAALNSLLRCFTVDALVIAVESIKGNDLRQILNQKHIWPLLSNVTKKISDKTILALMYCAIPSEVTYGILDLFIGHPVILKLNGFGSRSPEVQRLQLIDGIHEDVTPEVSLHALHSFSPKCLRYLFTKFSERQFSQLQENLCANMDKLADNTQRSNLITTLLFALPVDKQASFKSAFGLSEDEDRKLTKSLVTMTENSGMKRLPFNLHD